MELRFVVKDPQSYTGQCPAIYEATGADGRPGLVVQCKVLPDGTDSQLRDKASDEIAGWIPLDLLDAYIAQRA